MTQYTGIVAADQTALAAENGDYDLVAYVAGSLMFYKAEVLVKSLIGKSTEFPQCCGAKILCGFTYTGAPATFSDLEIDVFLRTLSGAISGIYDSTNQNSFFVLAKTIYFQYDPFGAILANTARWDWSSPIYKQLAKHGKLLSKWRNPVHSGRTCDYLYEFRPTTGVAAENQLLAMGDPGE